MTKLNFNAANTPPETNFKPLPNADYPCEVEKQEVKQTQAGTGYFLNLTMVVYEGGYKGRKIFDRVNLKNPNPKAEEIGRARLSAICRACGIDNLEDTEQLIGQKIMVSIGQEFDRDTKLPTGRNRVLGYEAIAAPTIDPMQTYKGVAPNRPFPTNPPVMPNPLDDDIPF